MGTSSILLVGILVICCWAAMAEEEHMKYKDAKQPLNVRIKDLMSRMTVEEKIGQTIQIDRTVASAQVINKYYLGKHCFIIHLSNGYGFPISILLRFSLYPT